MSALFQKKDYDRMRAEMVEILCSEYKIQDRAILDAMAKVPRHLFIPADETIGCNPYGDHPCPIGSGQTISQPFIVAYMTGRLEMRPGGRVLEIGTGSGYQSAILAEMGMEVFSVETIPALAAHARRILDLEGYNSVRIKTGDGYKGWPEFAPYDGIILTCGPEELPEQLVNQLGEGGRMILPLGFGVQMLVVLRKENGRINRKDDIMVQFVPMVHHS